MRIKLGNKVLEVTDISHPGGEDRFVWVKTSRSDYIIDCEKPSYAKWMLTKMLINGYFDATNIDYNNDLKDKSWFDYCRNKTEEQEVFRKSIVI